MWGRGVHGLGGELRQCSFGRVDDESLARLARRQIIFESHFAIAIDPRLAPAEMPIETRCLRCRACRQPDSIRSRGTKPNHRHFHQKSAETTAFNIRQNKQSPNRFRGFIRNRKTHDFIANVRNPTLAITRERLRHGLGRDTDFPQTRLRSP